MSIELMLFDRPPKVKEEMVAEDLVPLLEANSFSTTLFAEGAYELEIPFLQGFRKELVVFADGRGLFRFIPLDPNCQMINLEDNEISRKAGGSQYRLPEDLDAILLQENGVNQYLHGVVMHFDKEE